MHDLYWGYLQRGADENGYEFWVPKVESSGRAALIHAFGDSMEYGAEVGDLCAGTPQEAVIWLLMDQTRSVRVALNESGAVVGRHDYQAFGDEIIIWQQRTSSGSASERTPEATVSESTGLSNWQTAIKARYGSLERDVATGLEHTWWRKYDEWQGRWTSADPYLGSMEMGDPQTMNRYSYVGNDPVNRIDPSGLDDEPVEYFETWRRLPSWMDWMDLPGAYTPELTPSK